MREPVSRMCSSVAVDVPLVVVVSSCPIIITVSFTFTFTLVGPTSLRTSVSPETTQCERRLRECVLV